MTDTLRPIRDAMQKLRDKAAYFARMARKCEKAANFSKETHIQLMHRSDAVRWYASYNAYRNASCTIFHALRDAEKEMRKHDTVEKLRAMA